MGTSKIDRFWTDVELHRSHGTKEFPGRAGRSLQGYVTKMADPNYETRVPEDVRALNKQKAEVPAATSGPHGRATGRWTLRVPFRPSTGVVSGVLF